MKKYFFISLIAVLFLLGLVSFSAADAGVPRGKSASADVLPDELKSVKIEDYFVESKGLPAGSIQNATGYVVVVHKDTNKAYFAATGDAVYQQDVFYTLKDSRCRIKFSTEDIITMGESSRIVVEEIVDDQKNKEKKSSVSMLKGKAMFYVMRLLKYKKVSASVNTPTAVMGVRGTKFGVEVRKVSEKVADLSDNSFIYLAQNEPGNFETVVYGFEGTVDVTSTSDGNTQTVGAGENLVLDNTGSG
ncbi:MAG: FecR family protein, partial [Desulfobacterales bacterium]|nr:FecR family protein [Desulfobacterales bacterium]